MQHQNHLPDAPKPGAEYFDERQLAKHLNVSVRTLQGWRLKGDRMPYYKVGRLVRYSASEVKTWMSGLQCKHTSEAAAKGLCNIRQVSGYNPDTPEHAAAYASQSLANGSAA